jgi:hypothetical protein
MRLTDPDFESQSFGLSHEEFIAVRRYAEQGTIAAVEKLGFTPKHVKVLVSNAIAKLIAQPASNNR